MSLKPTNWQTIKATGRRAYRPAGKSRLQACVDEWLFDWMKAEAIRAGRSLSQQVEMVLVRYAEKRIK